VQKLNYDLQYQPRTVHRNENIGPRKTPISGFSSKWRRKLLSVWIAFRPQILTFRTRFLYIERISDVFLQVLVRLIGIRSVISTGREEFLGSNLGECEQCKYSLSYLHSTRPRSATPLSADWHSHSAIGRRQSAAVGQSTDSVRSIQTSRCNDTAGADGRLDFFVFSTYVFTFLSYLASHFSCVFSIL